MRPPGASCARRVWATAALLLLALAGACGGASKLNVHYDPAVSGPATLITPDGRVTASVPEGALTQKARLQLVNVSQADSAVPGPSGRALLLAFDFSAVLLEAPAAESGEGDAAGAATDSGSDTAAEVTLAKPVDFTLTLSPPLPAGFSLPLYRFSENSGRYEDASISSTVSADGASLGFALSEFGRFAVYGLLPAEFPPDPPGAPLLLAASVQVRRLGWDPMPAGLLGFNLYRSAAGADSFSKLNSELLSVTVYTDQLTAAGAYEYRLSVVAPDDTGAPGLESAPGPTLLSPEVKFDLAFTFGSAQLVDPFGLAIDTAGQRLFVADPHNGATGRIVVFDLEGRFITRLDHYGATAAVTPRGLAYNPQDGWLYVADPGLDMVHILDASLAGGSPASFELRGRFGSTGMGPGEFFAPACLALLGDKLIVGDRVNSQLQSFTPRGVYLATFALPGTLNGQVSGPRALLALSAGGLAVADSGNNRVQSYDDALAYTSTTILATSLDGPLLDISGIGEDFRQQLYVSDSGNRRVVVFDSSGEFLYHFGSSGSLIVEFGAAGPAGIAYDPATGYLYVCDPSNHRIAVFRS